MIERWHFAPAGSRSPLTGRWDLPTWASRTRAATRASPGIDLACRVQLGGSLSPVSSAANERNVCACHLVSRICWPIWINTGGNYCTVRPQVNNWWAENINKLGGGVCSEECVKTALSLQGRNVFGIIYFLKWLMSESEYFFKVYLFYWKGSEHHLCTAASWDK